MKCIPYSKDKRTVWAVRLVPENECEAMVLQSFYAGLDAGAPVFVEVGDKFYHPTYGLAFCSTPPKPPDSQTSPDRSTEESSP